MCIESPTVISLRQLYRMLELTNDEPFQLLSRLINAGLRPNPSIELLGTKLLNEKLPTKYPHPELVDKLLVWRIIDAPRVPHCESGEPPTKEDVEQWLEKEVTVVNVKDELWPPSSKSESPIRHFQVPFGELQVGWLNYAQACRRLCLTTWHWPEIPHPRNRADIEELPCLDSDREQYEFSDAFVASSKEASPNEYKSFLENCEQKQRENHSRIQRDGADHYRHLLKEAVFFVYGITGGKIPAGHPVWVLWDAATKAKKSGWNVRTELDVDGTRVHLGDFLEWARPTIPDVIEMFKPAPVQATVEPTITAPDTIIPVPENAPPVTEADGSLDESDKQPERAYLSNIQSQAAKASRPGKQKSKDRRIVQECWDEL